MHPVAIKSCWETSLYEKSTHINVPEPTYQELDLKENPHQNTTINWITLSVLHETVWKIPYGATQRLIGLTLSHKSEWMISKLNWLNDC